MFSHARKGRLLGVTFVAVLLVGLVGIPSATAEQSIGLNVGTIDLSLAPNQTASDSLIVANKGDEPLQVLMYTSDVQVDETGEPTYVRPQGDVTQYLSSPASWIRLQVPDSTKVVANTPYLQMDPGEEFQVDFDLVVPPNASPGDYNSVIFFEMFEFAPGDEGAVSSISGRLGARVVLRVVGDVVDKLEVKPFLARNFVIGDTSTFTTVVRNEGNIDKRYSLSLKLLAQGEDERWNQVLDEKGIVYARNTREYSGSVRFDGVGFGKYTFRAQVDYDQELEAVAGTLQPTTISVDRTIWIVPLWVAIAAILIVGVPAIWLSWRLSLRSSRKKRAHVSGSDSESSGGRRSRGKRGSHSAAKDRRQAREMRRVAETGEPEARRAAGVDTRAQAPAADRDADDWVPERLFDDLDPRDHEGPVS